MVIEDSFEKQEKQYDKNKNINNNYNHGKDMSLVPLFIVITLAVNLTIYNMFGIKYDSRLFMGSDIFSDHDPIVIFNDNSWISEKGRFNATLNKFYQKNKEETLPDNYVEIINNEVQNRINISTNLIKTNYYNELEK